MLLIACGSSSLEMVRKRHAIQFECDPGGMTVTDMGGETYLVTGCGPRATYKCIAQGSVYDNECILESVSDGGRTKLPDTSVPAN